MSDAIRDVAEPIALLEAAVGAVNRGDWDAVVALCDPASLAAFKRQLLQRVAPTAPGDDYTVDEMLRRSPDMPREAAEYQYAQGKKYGDPMRQLREQVPSIPSVEALREASPEAVYAAWLDGRTLRRVVERMAADGQIAPATLAAWMASPMPAHHVVPIGAVLDGERVAHVLYRHEHDATDVSELGTEWLADVPAEERELSRDLLGRWHPSIATSRRQPDGTWRMLATDGFLNLGSIALIIDETGSAGDASAG